MSAAPEIFLLNLLRIVKTDFRAIERVDMMFQSRDILENVWARKAYSHPTVCGFGRVTLPWREIYR
jgi:hypothetical protein